MWRVGQCWVTSGEKLKRGCLERDGVWLSVHLLSCYDLSCSIALSTSLYSPTCWPGSKRNQAQHFRIVKLLTMPRPGMFITTIELTAGSERLNDFLEGTQEEHQHSPSDSKAFLNPTLHTSSRGSNMPSASFLLPATDPKKFEPGSGYLFWFFISLPVARIKHDLESKHKTSLTPKASVNQLQSGYT